MKKILVIIVICAFAVSLTGCVKKSTDDTSDINLQENIDVNPKKNQATETNTSNLRTITIKVKNTEGMPIPGVKFNIAKTGTQYDANILGEVKIWSGVKEVYIPKISNYTKTNTIRFQDYENDIIDIVLTPAGTGNGFELIFPEVKREASKSGYTTIEGRVMYSNNEPVANQPIAIYKTSLGTKTDEQGNFRLDVLNESSSYRMYFPGLDVRKYYQIDTFKNMAAIINIEIQ